MTHAIDKTLFWAARILGLAIIAAVVFIAFQVLATAIVVLLVAAALVAGAVVFVRSRR